MIRLTAVMVVLAGSIFVSHAQAIQPGKTVTWNTPMGKVVFDGKNHADAGVKCLDCHSKILSKNLPANLGLNYQTLFPALKIKTQENK